MQCLSKGRCMAQLSRAVPYRVLSGEHPARPDRRMEGATKRTSCPAWQAACRAVLSSSPARHMPHAQARDCNNDGCTLAPSTKSSRDKQHMLHLCRRSRDSRRLAARRAPPAAIPKPHIQSWHSVAVTNVLYALPCTYSQPPSSAEPLLVAARQETFGQT